MGILGSLDQGDAWAKPPDLLLTPSGPSTLPAVAAPQPTKAAAPQGSLLALRFVSDHGLLRDESKTLAKSGNTYRKPEWRAKGSPQGFHSYPITQSKNTTVRVWLIFRLTPAGTRFTLKGDGGASYLRFRKKNIVASGARQAVALRSFGKLPGELTRVQQSISWTAETANGKVPLGTTGPHEIFVLWGKPKLSSSLGKKNYPTVARMRSLLGPGALGGADDLLKIGTGIQHYVNMWAQFGPEQNILAMNGDQVWGLLEKGTCQCGGGSTLAEMVARVLGVKATQKHVKAVTKLPVENHVSSAKRPRNAETRWCKVHGKESLIMLFRITPRSLNDGEGCNEIGGRLFPSHTSAIYGAPQGRRTAAHDLLLKMEKETVERIGYFQIWAFSSDKKSWEACALTKEKSGAGTPYPAVPPAP